MPNGTANSPQYYFILAESRNSPENDPLIIWLNGGPGCSSMLGLFTENGPYNWQYNASESIEKRAKFVYNDHSWKNEANVMFVDQPMATGFSSTDKIRDLRHS